MGISRDESTLPTGAKLPSVAIADGVPCYKMTSMVEMEPTLEPKEPTHEQFRNSPETRMDSQAFPGYTSLTSSPQMNAIDPH
jgi:hypothetical protein